MYKLCKTEESAKRQREMEQALLRMMLDHRYEEISVSELCAALAIPRKAFYRYFDSKDDALHALLDHTLEEFALFEANRSLNEPRSLRGELEQFFQFWYVHRALLDALERNSMTGVLLDTAIHFPLRNMVSPEKFLPQDSAWMRPRVFRFAICGLMVGVLEWYRGGFEETATAMSAMACRMLSRPLFPNLRSLGIME